MTNSKVQNANVYDFYAEGAAKNEYRINRISGIIGIMTLVCAVSVYIMSALEIFLLDTDKVLYTMLATIPPIAGDFIVSNILKVQKPWVKYFDLACDCITVLILFSLLSMHAVLILIYPIFKSCLYFNKKFTIIACISTEVLTLASHLLSVSLSITYDDPLIRSYERAIVFGFVPRFLIIALFSFIAIAIAHISSKAVLDGYGYASKAEKYATEQRKSHYEIIKNLATISENKSKDTGEHISRVFEYMYILCKHSGYPDEECYNISLAAMLHDVGKLCIDEKILSKPAKLTPEEFDIVKGHAAFGKDLLSNSSNEVMEMASVIADEHHERWDGKGYHGLKGEEIDKLSRLMSIVDVFDALTSRRCYKSPWTQNEAYKEIVNGRGTQFAPEAVDLFVSCFDEISEICDKMHTADGD